MEFKKKSKTIQFTMRIDEEVLNEIEAIADENSVAKIDVIRTFILEGLKKYKSGK